MTRHGTLAYYLAAWIVGCPISAVFYWLIGSVRADATSSSALFELCFFALMVGAADSLLFALLLRRLMYWVRARNLAIWSVAGAGLSLSLVFAFSGAGHRLHDSASAVASLASTFLFAGPAAIWASGWWQAPIEGAILGSVLFLIDRAFNSAAAGAAAEPPGQRAAAPTS